MRVLGLASYPKEAAATRFRLTQFVEPLRSRGIDLTISPFLDSEQFNRFYQPGNLPGKMAGLVPSLLRRLRESLAAGRYDAVIVQREAMFLGPAVSEWLISKKGRCPIILDLDDATYISYRSPGYGRLGSYFKFFGKTNKLIDRASVVICGNRFIAEYCQARGAITEVIPTVADTDIFTPVERRNLVPVLGWIGTHSTFPFIEQIFPVLERLALKHRFVLKLVGTGRADIRIPNVDIINPAWSLAAEVADFQSLDIGLYPITVSASASKEWLQGKSGFKAIQYLAVGVPFVMSPVGVCAEIGVAGETHLHAATADDWYQALDTLLADPDMRQRMGRNGRQYSVEHYGVPMQADKLAAVLRRLQR